MVLRITVFAIIIFFGAAFEPWDVMQEYVSLPLSRTLAAVTEAVLSVFGSNVLRYGAELRDPVSGRAILVMGGCNGIEAILILFACITVYPSCVKAKVIGLISGFFAVQGFNVIRLISLYEINIFSTKAFDFAHRYLWQSLIMIDVLIFLMLWLRWEKSQCQRI